MIYKQPVKRWGNQLTKKIASSEALEGNIQ
jgi:hypothetical protein